MLLAADLVPQNGALSVGTIVNLERDDASDSVLCYIFNFIIPGGVITGLGIMIWFELFM